ncbi:hypothetical protein CHH83_01930 [Bacillus sp. 7586-K]|nr:hypothetical protein CHH83_01930 [Bacillus sp. 7586-K]
MFYLHFKNYDISQTIEVAIYSQEIAELINFFLGSYMDLKFVVEGKLAYADDYFITKFNDWIREEVEWKVNDGYIYYDEEDKADEKYARLLELVGE